MINAETRARQLKDKQDPNEEIRSMSRKFEAISTTDQNLNSHDRSGNNQSPSNVNSSSPMNQYQEARRSIALEDNLLTRSKLGKNIPERIIFVVDTAKESDCTPFEIGSGAKYSPLYMTKRVIEIFVNAKGSINKKHEYALMKLTDNSSEWICDFTSNAKTLLNQLDKFEETLLDENCTDYDLAQCFEQIHKNVELDYSAKTPTFVTRVILIYSRSHCLPDFSDMKHFELLMDNSNFFLDVIYVHERPTEENECEEVYVKLTALDKKQNSFIFEVARNAATLHNTMAKLLAHPLQRPKQEDAYYNVCIAETSPEVQTNV